MKIICDCGRCFVISTTKITSETPLFKRRLWNKKADTLLGKMPDEKVAKIVGRTIKAVERRREKLGKRSFYHR